MTTETTDFMPHDVVIAAVNAATLAAIRKARATGTNVLVWGGNSMVEITPDEAEAQFYASLQNPA